MKYNQLNFNVPQIDRHVRDSREHQKCVQMEQALLPSERAEGVPTPISVQTKVGGGEGVFQKTTVEATRKLA